MPRILASFLLAVLLAAPAPGESVAVQNPGFESPVFADGGAGLPVTGWQFVAIGSANYQIFNPRSGDYLAGIPEGLQVLVAGGGGEFVEQSPAVVENSTRYELRVAVGRRVTQTDWVDYGVELRAGGVVVAGGGQPYFAPGAWAESVAMFETSAADPRAGQALTIRLISYGSQMQFDHVRLTKTALAAPPPATECDPPRVFPSSVITSPPLHVGEIAPEVRAHHDAGAGWQNVAVDGVEVVDLGGGEIYLAGLPLAVDRERWWFGVANSVNGELLAEYAYGASPGQRLTHLLTMDLEAGTRVFKEGDTYGDLVLRVASGLPPEIAGASATFTLERQSSGEVVVPAAPAAVVNVVEHVPSGTWGADLVYTLGAGDLAQAGRMIGEWTVCYGVDACHVLPADNSYTVRVVRRLGGLD